MEDWLIVEGGQSCPLNHFPCLFRGTIGDMMQKLSGQLSGARNKGEFGDWALG